jgi:hypothetical protein
MPIWVVGFIALFLSACGLVPDLSWPKRRKLFEVFGAEVAVAEDFMREPDYTAPPASITDPRFPAIFEAAMRDAAAFWGVDPSVLSDHLILFTPPFTDCGQPDTTMPRGGFEGCYTRDQRLVRLVPYPDCPEFHLFHEFGHAALPNSGDHRDPRWANVTAHAWAWRWNRPE